MSKRAEELATQFIGHPRGVDESLSITMARDAYQQAYEQAEKDIEARILRFLDSRADSDYATVGFIKQHFEEYKKRIIEEEK